MKKVREFKGFTLLELLIVVVILAILAGLALPQYLRTVARAKEAEGWTNLSTLRSAQTRYYAEYQAYQVTGGFGKLDVDIPAAAAGMFAYSAAVTGNTFTATALPSAAKCQLCRTLTVQDTGARSAF